jgi:hypothetical protein
MSQTHKRSNRVWVKGLRCLAHVPHHEQEPKIMGTNMFSGTSPRQAPTRAPASSWARQRHTVEHPASRCRARTKRHARTHTRHARARVRGHLPGAGAGAARGPTRARALLAMPYVNVGTSSWRSPDLERERPRVRWPARGDGRGDAR